MRVASLLLALCLWPAAMASARTASEQARDQLAAKLDLGESAPDWLMESETYAIGYNPGEWDALAASKVAFITHCPINAEFFARAHAHGIRCFPYVTFYQAPATYVYQDVDLRLHPEFIEVDAKGNLTRTGFWESEDAKNWYTTCPNEPGYQDAMVAWVRRIMSLGADGVFVDNLAPRAPCAGPQHGKHKHVTDDQTHAFALLLKRVREVIKQAQPDGAVLGNSASPLSLPREFWKYLDAEMLESYICTWVSKERWFDWAKHWHRQGVELQPFVRAGKQIQCLSYLGHTPYGVREDAFYCYASARLGGMVWNGGTGLANPESSVLYQIRLGRPLGDEQEENGVHYRVFERGFVAVNPQKDRRGAVTIKPPMPTGRLVDIAGGAAKWWTSGRDSQDTLALTAAHSGKRCVGMTNLKPAESIVSQTVTLNQTKPTPILAGGWSKAENAGGARDSNYAVYLDIQYVDGTNLFGQVATFAVGTHDWEYQQVVVKPEKPIRSLTFNALFRYRTGTVWFDDLTLKEGDDPANGTERLQNGGFEETGGASRLLNTADTGGKVEIPAYSGRVYLFGADSADQAAARGPRLTVVTKPGLGEVRFRVDGFDYWTHSGYWTTEYTMGSNFGRFEIQFKQPGKHTIEIVDVVPAAMKTPKGYGAGERLGPFMDPSQPTKPLGKKQFRFREWTGAAKSKAAKLEAEITADLTLTAEFDVEGGGG